MSATAQHGVMNRTILGLLFLYHSFYIYAAYAVRVKRGNSDAHFYWGKTFDIHNYGWFDFFSFGSDFVLFVNYFFIKSGLPFAFGFILYGSIGFLGIVQFYRFLNLAVPDFFRIGNFDTRLLILFLPTLHFWTGSLGKEAICFLCIATLLLKIAQRDYQNISFITAALFLVVLRPHTALMLFFSIYVCYLLWGNWNIKIKGISLVAALLVFVGLFKMFMVLAQLQTFEWATLMRYNRTSLLSFQDSGTYVPIAEYGYPYKLFTFYFRPLPFEIPTFFGMVLGMENLVVLLLHFLTVVLLIRYGRRVHFGMLFKILLLYAIVSGILIVQRYSGFGIFARTKIMIQPFVLVALLSVLAQFQSLFSNTGNEKTD